MSLKLLILSPYDAMSHRYWRRQLMLDLEDWRDVTVTEVTLPARYFSWRFRGNSLTLSQDDQLKQQFDLLIATSMTDLATLRGLRPELITVPTILYFHENQFAYPDRHPERQVERQLTSIYSAMAADQLVFNSEFNRRTFLDGAKSLLDKMPDGVPAGVEEGLGSKSQVIAVPIAPLDQERDSSIERTIVWNHRWEHDKGLTELEQIVDALLATKEPFKFHLIGQKFRSVPDEISRIESKLGEHLGQLGFVEGRDEYRALLASSNIVLSTARHEFQGLAVLEAIAAGCRPVVPDDLAYQELVPEVGRYQTVAGAIKLLLSEKPQVTDLPPQVSPEYVRRAWHKLLQAI